MNKTTCTLAFLIVLLVTACASAILVARQSDARPVRRIQPPAEERADARSARRSERKRLTGASAGVDALAEVRTAAKSEPEKVALNKPEAAGSNELVGATAVTEHEPLTEEFTEYDSDGRLCAIWRGYTPAGEQGTLKVTRVDSDSAHAGSLKDTPVDFDRANLTNAVDQASDDGEPRVVRWKSSNGYEGKTLPASALFPRFQVSHRLMARYRFAKFALA